MKLQINFINLIILVFLACSADAQESFYRISCKGSIYGSGASIQGVYYLSDTFNIDNREVRFEGTIHASNFGNGVIKLDTFLSNHPFPGTIFSPLGNLPIQIWQEINPDGFSGTWTIEENYPSLNISQPEIGKFFCNGVPLVQ